MTDRIQRAAFLGEQLAAAMRALGESTRGTDALLFLDRLARLDGYAVEEVRQVEGLERLLVEARSARSEHALELGVAAGRGVDLERFLEVGRHLPVDDVGGQRDGWLRDLVLVATVLPWLSGARQKDARTAVEWAQAFVEAEPEAFLDAASLVADRRTYEDPDSLSPEARSVLATLADLPLLVIFDQAAGVESEGRVDRALGRAPEDDVEAAEDALLDRELAAGFRLPRASESRVFYAADAVGTAMYRMVSGVWELVQRAGRQSLRWNPDAAEGGAAVEVLDGAARGPIVPNEHAEFVLPVTSETLTLLLRVGSDSRVVQLHPAEA